MIHEVCSQVCNGQDLSQWLQTARPLAGIRHQHGRGAGAELQFLQSCRAS